MADPGDKRKVDTFAQDPNSRTGKDRRARELIEKDPSPENLREARAIKAGERPINPPEVKEEERPEGSGKFSIQEITQGFRKL
jgi:hypothetical protein